MVPGNERIDVPAIGDGLCLHNLFQTGMLLEREKPIHILGWGNRDCEILEGVLMDLKN